MFVEEHCLCNDEMTLNGSDLENTLFVCCKVYECVKGEVVSVHAMKAYKRIRRIALLVLNLGTS